MKILPSCIHPHLYNKSWFFSGLTVTLTAWLKYAALPLFNPPDRSLLLPWDSQRKTCHRLTQTHILYWLNKPPERWVKPVHQANAWNPVPLERVQQRQRMDVFNFKRLGKYFVQVNKHLMAKNNVQVSVAPHPEMLHSDPSAKGSLGRQAAFTSWLSLAHSPLDAFTFSKAASQKQWLKSKLNEINKNI